MSHCSMSPPSADSVRSWVIWSSVISAVVFIIVFIVASMIKLYGRSRRKSSREMQLLVDFCRPLSDQVTKRRRGGRRHDNPSALGRRPCGVQRLHLGGVPADVRVQRPGQGPVQGLGRQGGGEGHQRALLGGLGQVLELGGH